MGKKTLGGLDTHFFFEAGWSAAVEYCTKAKTLPDNVILLRPQQRTCDVWGGPCVGREACTHGDVASSRGGGGSQPPTDGTRVGVIDFPDRTAGAN